MYKYAKWYKLPERASQFNELDRFIFNLRNQAYDYIDDRRGRGPSHKDAYVEGVNKTIEAILQHKCPQQLSLWQ